MSGSFHKLKLGYNSHNGFNSIEVVVKGLIDIFEKESNLKLPSFENWYIDRIDISYCYDLLNQDNVKNYINNNRYLVYPRRRTQYFLNECVYFAGSRTTLKIYNKYAEFLKHDKKRLEKFKDFNIASYKEEIKGFVRFECEIRKKKLFELFYGCKFSDVKLEELEKYVKGEFMKLFKINENSICIVRTQNDVKNLLYSKFSDTKARRLFGFYLSCVNDGLNNVKEEYSKSSYFRNVADLKDSGIDFNQQAFIVEEKVFDNKFIDFTPFIDSRYKEVV